MRRKERNTDQGTHQLVCPACGKRIKRAFGSHREPESPLVPQIGQLTECDHCLAILEYIPRAALLALRLAPRKRMDAFSELVKDTLREPRLVEIIDYVMTYRAMPSRCNKRRCVPSRFRGNWR